MPAISGGPTFESIQALAHRYVEEIRRVQPSGPYHLLGWSLGGVIAHAIAVDLRAAGDEVATLAVMDSYPTNGADDTPDHLTVSELVHGLGLDIGDRVRDDDLTYERAVELIDDAIGQRTGLAAEHLAQISAGFDNSARLMRQFRPGIFDGEMLFFRANGDDHSPHEWDAAVTGGIREVAVPYAHNQMIEPEPLRLVGHALEEYLGG